MANKTTLTAEQAAANAQLAAAYIEQAQAIARGKAAIDKAKEKIENAQGGQWQAFKDAGRHGLTLGHDADTMAKGVTLACAELKVPQGTVNAYLPLVRKMYAAVLAGELVDDVFRLSVKEARTRFQPPKTKPAPAQPAPQPSGESKGESTSDENGMIGETPRSRLLSEINAILATLSDDDLAAVLDSMGEWSQAEAA